MNHLSTPNAVGEILDTGFLVQTEGINPATGEAWKPMWVPRDKCPAQMIARWEARNGLSMVIYPPLLPSAAHPVTHDSGCCATNEQAFCLTNHCLGLQDIEARR